ncbi:fimbrial protein [Aquitalea denitrificans]|uniref:fimbrial protein n=1 Tax=Aquitalea denitrificans TaxID=519081 RepID=UPI00135A8C9B|nr:fimbrial protein [Aquitalea denitrificans]
MTKQHIPIYIAEKIGLLISIAILPSVTYACTTSYPTIVPLTIPQSSIIAPARDAPLITPLSAWATTTLSPAYTRCSTTTMTYFYIGMLTSALTRVGYYFDPSDGINYPVWGSPGSTINFGVGFIAGGGSNGSNITPIDFYAPYTLYEAKIPNTTEPIFAKLRLMRYAPITLTKVTYGYTNWVGFVVSYKSPAQFDPASSRITGVTFTSNNQTWTVSTGSAAASCSVNTQNLQVNLPAIDAKQLSSVGATTGNTPFSLWVNCPSTTPVNVYMTLTDNSKPGQTNSTVVSAASGSSASGVGVQISDQYGLPITLGPDSSMAGNPGQFLVRSNLTGSLPIPFTASYIRTGTIKPGTLKAIATFTMSYQ